MEYSGSSSPHVQLEPFDNEHLRQWITSQPVNNTDSLIEQGERIIEESAESLNSYQITIHRNNSIDIQHSATFSTDEPKLKYQRLEGTYGDILNKDSFSCLAYHEKFLVVGTHWGVVCVLDVFGNEIKRYATHSAAVSCVTIDSSGDYFASSGDDGKVCVYQLGSENVTEYIHSRSVKAIALSPNFSKTFQFVFGGMGGKLVLCSKGWLGVREDLVHSSDEGIFTISWHRNYITWCNESNLFIYDLSLQQIIGSIDKPQSCHRADIYRAHISWLSDSSMMFGWGKSVVQIRLSKAVDAYTHSVEILTKIDTKCFILGLTYYNGEMMLLSLGAEEIDEQNERQRFLNPKPEIQILGSDLTVSSLDTLDIIGYENYRPIDYKLVSGEDCLYIVSPRDILIAKAYETDDRIRWLLEKQRFEAAYEVLENDQYSSFKLSDIGELMFESFFQRGQIDKITERLDSVLGKSKERWEKWITVFTNENKISELFEKIPLREPKLDLSMYTNIMLKLLQENPEKFYQAVRTWDIGLYEVETLINTLSDEVQKEVLSAYVLEAAAYLYLKRNNIEAALDCYLRLGKEDSLDFIRQFNLYAVVKHHLELLFNFDEQRESKGEKPEVIEFLVKNLELIPIQDIVENLRYDRKRLFKYLDSLFRRDPRLTSPYHSLQLELYADYDPTQLLNFLKSGTSYSLERALKVCQSQGLVVEQVYLLGRMGNNKVAMQIILNQLNNYRMAIEFAKEQNDPELWEDLVNESMYKPVLIQNLLIYASMDIDPIAILERMPKKQRLIEFRDGFIQIIHEYTLQISLLEGCKRIFTNDEIMLLQDVLKKGRAPFELEAQSTCNKCGKSIIVQRQGEETIEEVELLVFRCKHFYHNKCEKDFKCRICMKEKQ